MALTACCEFFLKLPLAIRGAFLVHYNTFSRAALAQLDRASDYGSEGCRFNSCVPRQDNKSRLRGGAAW